MDKTGEAGAGSQTASYAVQYDLTKLGETAVGYTLTDTLDYSAYTDYISGVALNSSKLYEYNTTTKQKEAEMTLAETGTSGAASADVLYTFTDSGGKAVITLTGSASGTVSYILEYTYGFTYTAAASGHSIEDLTNTATLTTDTSKVPLSVGSKVTKKVDEAYDNDTNQVSYQVEINTSGTQLTSNGSGTLTVSETLDYSDYTSSISGVSLANVNLYLYDSSKTDGKGAEVDLTANGITDSPI